MSVYQEKKKKTYRYDFTYQKQRYTEAGFTTKRDALREEAARKEELKNPPPEVIGEQVETPTDMGFKELLNRRLDHVKAYRSERHYTESYYVAKRWLKEWGDILCSAITRDSLERFILKRSRVSGYTANKELRYLRATFNFAVKREWIERNPTEGLEFLPVEKKVKVLPSHEDIERVIAAADAESQDYLWTIRETMARVSEVNKLEWKDVDLEGRAVYLYTRKSRGGNLVSRRVPMTEKLHAILARRFKARDKAKPWVFWHSYRRCGAGNEVGPYKHRKRLMKGLCKKAGVDHFGFHALRHHGASVLDQGNVPIGSIQKILGHSNRTTTEIYLHSIGDAERDAMKVFESMTKKSHTKSHTEANAV